MAQTSLRHGARALRTALLAQPTPQRAAQRPIALQCASRRLLTSRGLFSQHATRPGLPGRPGLSIGCPSCIGRIPSQPAAAQPRRAFHLASLANATVDAAQASIAQLHAVSHTPWYLTIPLVALCVNLVFRVPFSLHARTLAQKRERLAPVLQAWAAVHSKNVHQERRQLVRERREQAARSAGEDGTLPPVDMSTASIQGEVMKRYRKTAARVYSTFGVQQWKLYGNLLTLPPWLVVIEAIRQMCGAPVGLLGMVFRGGAAREASEASEAAAAAATTTAATAATASAETVDVASVALSDVAAMPPADAAAMAADPAFAVGGCLWFPDLTVADPYHVLPFALSAMLIANVLPGTDAGRRAMFGLGPARDSASGSSAVVAQSRVASVLQRTLLIMSASVGFATLNFPAAIHLYWLASAATSFLITRLIRFLRPIPTSAIRPTNRPDFPWIRPPPAPSLGGAMRK